MGIIESIKERNNERITHKLSSASDVLHSFNSKEIFNSQLLLKSRRLMLEQFDSLRSEQTHRPHLIPDQRSWIPRVFDTYGCSVKRITMHKSQRWRLVLIKEFHKLICPVTQNISECLTFYFTLHCKKLSFYDNTILM